MPVAAELQCEGGILANAGERNPCLGQMNGSRLVCSRHCRRCRTAGQVFAMHSAPIFNTRDKLGTCVMQEATIYVSLETRQLTYDGLQVAHSLDQHMC